MPVIYIARSVPSSKQAICLEILWYENMNTNFYQIIFELDPVSSQINHEISVTSMVVALLYLLDTRNTIYTIT